MNTLTRLRSAPSTFFTSFLDAVDNTVSVTNCNDGGGGSGGGGGGGGGGERGDFSTSRPLSPETENIFARFMSSMGDGDNNNNNNASSSQNSMTQPPQFLVGVKQETETLPQQPPQQQVVYQSQSKPPLARQKSASIAMENPFTAVTGGGGGSDSMGMDSVPPQMMKIGGGNSQNNNSSSGLTRHSSSPAGFLANILNIDDGGFGVTKGMGNYGGGNGPINLTSAPSTSGVMSQNSDVGTKRFSTSVNNNDGNYMTGSGYAMTSWDDSILSENFSSLDDDRKTFFELHASENQVGEVRNRPPLSHQLSLPLPNTSAKLSTMEKLLHFQESVPCRIRAKRGCATHPRSIAERVRRTRISERMRKLQDLVPNMDKQTNTADMLDLAIEYIKDLQEQVKILADNRDKCTCS